MKVQIELKDFFTYLEEKFCIIFDNHYKYISKQSIYHPGLVIENLHCISLVFYGSERIMSHDTCLHRQPAGHWKNISSLYTFTQYYLRWSIYIHYTQKDYKLFLSNHIVTAVLSISLSINSQTILCGTKWVHILRKHCHFLIWKESQLYVKY